MSSILSIKEKKNYLIHIVILIRFEKVKFSKEGRISF